MPNKVERLINQLVEQYKYKKLPLEISQRCRDIYLKNIPTNLSVDGGNEIYTLKGTLIAKQYERIVIGDYGAFIEINSPELNKLQTQIGEEYRQRQEYNAKYEWLTINDGSNIKIYYQKHPVNYADYIPNKYYISVYEVLAKG